MIDIDKDADNLKDKESLNTIDVSHMFDLKVATDKTVDATTNIVWKLESSVGYLRVFGNSQSETSLSISIGLSGSTGTSPVNAITISLQEVEKTGDDWVVKSGGHNATVSTEAQGNVNVNTIYKVEVTSCTFECGGNDVTAVKNNVTPVSYPIGGTIPTIPTENSFFLKFEATVN